MAPDRKTAIKIARTLVSSRLAACVNFVEGATSIYRWKGEVHEDSEVLCLVKTQHKLVQAVIEKITELHPYEVPEIVFLSIEEGLADYLDWIFRQTTAP